MTVSPTRRRSTAVAARGTAMFAAAVLATAGCGGGTDPDDVEYQSTCHDAEGVRVDDENCDDERRGGAGIGFFPLFWILGSRFPAIGQRSSAFPGAVRTLPAGGAAVAGAARSGGTVTRDAIRTNVSRGGFGTSSRGGGTGG